MVRLADLHATDREHLMDLARRAPKFSNRPWVKGPPLRKRRVALITTAGLHRRGDTPFDNAAEATSYRVIPGDTRGDDLVMSHISVNFDRSGFRQDLNVVFPIDRLRELERDGEIGSCARFHYSFMGAPFPPTRFEAKARELARLLKADQVDAAVLCPV